jgi:hypothetical protein
MTFDQMRAQADDRTCQSWGVKPGTEAYYNCRVELPLLFESADDLLEIGDLLGLESVMNTVGSTLSLSLRGQHIAFHRAKGSLIHEPADSRVLVGSATAP